jgi:hypothetical protein
MLDGLATSPNGYTYDRDNSFKDYPTFHDPYWKLPYRSEEEIEIANYLANLAFNTFLDDHLANPCTIDDCLYITCREKKWKEKHSA